MVSKLCDDLGSLVIKSIVILSHFHSGIAGCTNSPDGLWCSALTLTHVRFNLALSDRHPTYHETTTDQFFLNTLFWSTVEYGVSTSTGYGISSSLSNTTYSSQQINTAYPLLLDTTMTKVIKGEFEKIKDIKVEDDSLACDSPLEVFNLDDDSEHETNDIGFDPSDIAFTEWLGSKFFNYKTMDDYTMKALWIYWIRGDDEVELTDEEFSDNEDEIA
ncbi:hypothetical protein Tco_0295119 [Tanacetum coccineum]